MNTGISENEAGAKMPEASEIAVLNDIEKDTLGEISNICMGTCATTLSTLLGKRVVITTPKVSVCMGSEYLNEYERPVVAAEVAYTQGLDGKNVFLLKKDDSLLITRLLMGELSDDEIGDLYLSAMSEVMNQMIGSSSTALADILHVHINISPPVTTEYSSEDQVFESVFLSQALVRISFRMEIEGLLESNIMQMMPYEFAKKLVASLTAGEAQKPAESRNFAMEEAFRNIGDEARVMAEPDVKKTPKETTERVVELRTAKFQPFEEDSRVVVEKAEPQNIDLIIDVPLQVTVVLGKSKKSIREILEMGLGSVIVLDRLAGETVDVLVNGKIFARGEVVVIDDNYGVRITEMMSGNIKM